MAALAAAAPFMMAASAAMGAVGQMQAAEAAKIVGQRRKQAAEFEAAQLTQNAGQVVAASQRDRMEQERQGQLTESRVLALAAASGGGASDPTIVNLIARNRGETGYRANVALYQGEEKARQMLLGAEAKTFEGMIAEEGGELEAGARKTMAIGNLLQGGGSMFAKYGG